MVICSGRAVRASRLYVVRPIRRTESSDDRVHAASAGWLQRGIAVQYGRTIVVQTAGTPDMMRCTLALGERRDFHKVFHSFCEDPVTPTTVIVT